MSSVYLVLPVVLPILGGAVMPLLHLPEKQRNRITSHFLLGMSISEIAKSEGSGVSSVHEGIQRGLRRLKKILEEI